MPENKLQLPKNALHLTRCQEAVPKNALHLTRCQVTAPKNDLTVSRSYFHQPNRRLNVNLNQFQFNFNGFYGENGIQALFRDGRQL